MTRTREAVVVWSVLASLAVAYAAASARLAPAARSVPAGVAALTIALLVLDAGRVRRGVTAPAPAPGAGRSRELAMAGWIGLLPPLVLLLGLLAGVSVFLAAFLRVRSSQPWRIALWTGVCAGFAGHLLLVAGLGLPVHEGWVRTWLGW
jgi:hypothetical protein